MELEPLNTRFAIPGQLGFRALDGGLMLADIDNGLATASVALQGGHVVTWRPKSETEPVVWVSDAAAFAPGKSIRGGIPVCWPWFGAHASEPGFPAHGFARTAMWQVTATCALADGATRIDLELPETAQTRAQWPHATRLEIRITIGAALAVELLTHNLGAQPVVIGEALHTYFRIGDIADVQVNGLDGSTYLDKVGAPARRLQSGAVGFAGEVDRVYVDTGADCVIDDTRLGRRIRIAKQGSRSTVVWTPWLEKAVRMGDLGPGSAGQGGWREMVCVESGNMAENVVSIAPGATHTLAVRYSVERG